MTASSSRSRLKMPSLDSRRMKLTSSCEVEREQEHVVAGSNAVGHCLDRGINMVKPAIAVASVISKPLNPSCLRSSLMFSSGASDAGMISSSVSSGAKRRE